MTPGQCLKSSCRADNDPDSRAGLLQSQGFRDTATGTAVAQLSAGPISRSVARQRKPEALVPLRNRILGAACIAGAVLTTLPEPAEAQRRTAVRVGVGVGTRGVRPRATVIVRSSRYRPAYYSAWGPW